MGIMKSCKCWPFSTIVVLAITVLSLIPVPDVPVTADVPLFDKWVHFIMYGTLTCCIWYDAWRNSYQLYSLFIFALLSFVCPALFGGLLELAQAYLTTCRSGDWIDFYADAFGSSLGFVVSFLFFYRKLKFRSEGKE